MRSFFSFLIAALLCQACGDGTDDPDVMSDPLKGSWVGTLDTLEVVFDIQKVYDQAGSRVMQGTASTNRAACFGSSSLQGQSTNASVQLITQGGGSESTTTFLKFTATLNGDSMTGKLEMTGSGSCMLAPTDVTFTRAGAF